MTGRFTDYEMEQLADMVLNRSKVHVVFTAPSMLGSARVFSRLIQIERDLYEEETEAWADGTRRPFSGLDRAVPVG